MEKFLAPNGKPSNLTPEQYKLVRTPAFKNWFGDWEKLALTKINDSGIDEISLKRLEDGVSKVVDENGEPLVVLHGSREKITLFSSERLIFTTTNKKVSEYFGYSVEYFMNIKNPFIIKGHYYNTWDRIDECFLINKLGKEKFIEIINKEYKQQFTYEEWLQFVNEVEAIPVSIDVVSIYIKNSTDYDGVIAFDIEETTEHIKADDYISFNPNQIKLADGSNTTFDGNNPDIRFKEGGLIAPNGKRSGLYFTEIYNLVRTKEFKEWFGDWEEAYRTKNYDGVSKIIDENGEPLICVHNTPYEFYEFDEYEIGKNTDAGFYGKGFYFTPNVGQSRYGEIELNCFLNIKNPYFKKSSHINYELKSDELKNQGYDGVLVYPNWIEDFNFENGVDGCEEVVAYYSEQIKLGDGRNTNFYSYNPDIRYAKGGSVIAYKKDSDKFKKIGITDKYIIEAINEIGLQGIKFDSNSINERIGKEFEELIKDRNVFNNYIISEDSNAITKQIEAEIQTRINQGDTQQNIDEYKSYLQDPYKRKQYIDDYAKNQTRTIGEWLNYLRHSIHPVAFKYLILKAVFNYNYDYKTNDLIKRTKKTIRNFTPFDAGSLAELVAMNSDNLLQDYTQIQVENAVKIISNKELLKTSNGGKWIKFDGGSKTDQKVRRENAKELSQLVQNTYWCTKTNASSQLDGGDFYVYVTQSNGEIFPRIAIRMEEDKVGEVRGNKSSAQDLEDEMIPIAKDFLENNIPNDSGKKWLNSIEYNQKAINLYNQIIAEGLFENSIEEFIELKSKEKDYLLDYADRNGNIVRIEEEINKLVKNLPNKYYKKNEVVFDLDDFNPKETRIILGDAYFEYSQITDLANLESIGGFANFNDSKITSLGNLESIGGNSYFENSQITSLGNLKSIGGSAYFKNSQITDLGNLKSIGGFAYFKNSQITSLGNLESIGLDANFENSQITDLGNLESIGNSAYFENSQITDLGNLESIGGNAYFENSQITDLGNLESIGGSANFSGSKITSLGNLESIGSSAYFNDSQITDLGNLESIGSSAYFNDSQITDLGNLKSIGGYAYFINSKITSLGKLKSIGGSANFSGSKITSLGNLESIGGFANFEYSQIISLGNLKSIGGNTYFENSQITSLGNLESIGGNADFSGSKIKDLGNLISIGGIANFIYSQITSLGNLKSIGGNAHFGNRTDLKQEWEKISNNPDIRYAKGGVVRFEYLKNIYNSNQFLYHADFGKNGKVTWEIPSIEQRDKNGKFSYLIVQSMDSNWNQDENYVKERGEGSKVINDLFQAYPHIKSILYDDESEGFWTAIGGDIDELKKEDFYEYYNKKYKNGGRTIAQTPAPKKEIIYGSEKNKPESSKDTKSAEKIEFNEKTLETIKNKVAEHNEKHPNKKITLASAKAVVRRGMGAYSSSHRPTIKGGKPNSRVAWGLARLNAFLYKIVNGRSKSGKYNQDDDLINELGYKVKKYEIGGIFHGSRYNFNKFNTNKIGSGIGQQDSGWGIYLTDAKEGAKNYGNYIYETTLFKGKKIGEYNFLDLSEPVKKDLVRKIVEAVYKLYNKDFDINKFNFYYEYIKDKSLPKVDFNDYELIEFDYSGYLFYKTLSRTLGGDEKASLFLLNNGIDGSIKKYKNHKGEIYRTDYVIYDENAITINNIEYSNHLWSDGGYIQAYEEAMGISEYVDGGETEEPTEFWGTEAGGVLIYCIKTDRFLILLRSMGVLEPNTWGIVSGKLDEEDIDIEEAVSREAKEEIGYELNNLIPTYIFQKPNFKFYNFVSIVEEEFEPILNWENADYKWIELDEFPDNLHFGLKKLIENENLHKLIENNKYIMEKLNPKDAILIDVPLLIRICELMREDIKSDVQLHEVIENVIDLRNKGVLTMKDYNSIIKDVVPKENIMKNGGQTQEQSEKIRKVMQEFKEGNLTSHGKVVADRQQAIAIALSEAGVNKKEEGGKVESIHSTKGDIKLSLEENWYSDDTDVELVPVSELMKFREFDRKLNPKYNKENSIDNINHLKFMFQKDGVKSPLIIEYSKEDNAVLIIEGNHRLNSAIDLGMEYLPARVVLKKYSKFPKSQLKNAMKVSGVEGDQYGYIPSSMKPSKVGIQGTKSLVFGDGGIIEGRLHSECGDDGCGRKFQVGENGHIIEAERDEAVIVANSFNDNEKYTIKGTPSEVASALNVIGGGKNFDKGAEIIKNSQELEIPELKKEATDTDVEDVIDSGSIIINRRSMYDKKEYEVTGTPKQIASAINSINGNGVVIEKGAEIKEN